MVHMYTSQSVDIQAHLTLSNNYCPVFYSTLLSKSVRDIAIASLRPSVTLSPPKPLDKIQPNLVCELLT